MHLVFRESTVMVCFLKFNLVISENESPLIYSTCMSTSVIFRVFTLLMQFVGDACFPAYMKKSSYLLSEVGGE